jgi:hypothetical protein
VLSWVALMAASTRHARSQRAGLPALRQARPYQRRNSRGDEWPRGSRRWMISCALWLSDRRSASAGPGPAGGRLVRRNGRRPNGQLGDKPVDVCARSGSGPGSSMARTPGLRRVRRSRGGHRRPAPGAKRQGADGRREWLARGPEGRLEDVGKVLTRKGPCKKARAKRPVQKGPCKKARANARAKCA